MNINLKQREIAIALRNHLVQQGINLTGKTVDIQFTATRGGAGIVADITIEEPGMVEEEVKSTSEVIEHQLPPLKTLTPDNAKTVANLVAEVAAVAETAPKKEAKIKDVPLDMATGEPIPQEDAPTTKVASLFG
jgi:hypothetical protein